MSPTPSVLPDSLSAALGRLKARLDARRDVARVYPDVLAGLTMLAPALLGRAEDEIVSRAGIHPWYRSTPSLPARILGLSERGQLKRVPGLEFLFLLHRDGHLREAALRKLAGPIPSASLFVMLAWRLNDWVPQVRSAAVECAERVFPLTSPEVIAEAATILLGHNATWRRWDVERAQLSAAFDRPDVAAALADRLAKQRSGPSATILRAALRTPAIDGQLARLAREAIQPATRALALQALIDGFVSWPDGWRWRWIDKSLGKRRAETVFAKRPLAVRADSRAMIVAGLADRSGTVRNAAIAGLIRRRDVIADARSLAEPHLRDRSAPVRERAAFLLR